MSRDRDSDDERGERPRLSWRDIDRRRDRARSSSDERRPRGAAAEARAKQATREYVKRLDGLFARDTGGTEGARLAKAVHDAHGTPQLAEACRAYRDALGLPEDPALLSLFLDSRDREIMLGALHTLAGSSPDGEQRLSGGVRSQLRMLAEDPDDEIAEAAEDLLSVR